MLESNLVGKKKKYSTAKNGIDIDGWNGTVTTSPGVTQVFVEGKLTFNFSPSAVNWVRIPYAGTPYPRGEDCDIAVKFNIRNIPSGYVIVWSKFRQGDNVASIMPVVRANGNVIVYFGGATYPTASFVTFNAEHELKTTRRGSVYTTYLDGVQILQFTAVGNDQAAYDWTFGSYFDPYGNIITTTYANPADWTLLGISIKRA